MEKFLQAILSRSSEAVEKLMHNLQPKPKEGETTLLGKQLTENKAKISPRQKWHHQEKAVTITPISNNSKGASEAPTVSDKGTRKKPNYRVSPAPALKIKTNAGKLVKSLSTEMREAEEKKKLLLEELR